jgi:hypothetical protein
MAASLPGQWLRIRRGESLAMPNVGYRELMPEPTPMETVDVGDWAVGGLETIGGEEKYWLIEPSTETRWLFKPNNTHPATSDRDAWTQREDIAETVAAEIAVLMGVPCATIKHAQRGAALGCISRNLTPEGWELQTGAVLLDQLLDDYVPGRELSNKQRKGHSLGNIREALKAYGAPAGFDVPSGFDAFDVFVGFVVLDALIANRDRHDENWAILRPAVGDERPTLAGSFDHGRALGSTCTEAKMDALVRAGRIEWWAQRGTAWRFEHEMGQKPPTLVALSHDALSMVTADVRDHWLRGVSGINDEQVVRITDYLAETSEVTRTFVRQVVATNRRRVLDVDR